MLSNIGISLIVLILVLSVLIIYAASLDLKSPGKTIKKRLGRPEKINFSYK